MAQRKKEEIMMEFRHLCYTSPLKLRREGGYRIYQPNCMKENTSNYARTVVVNWD